MNRLKLLAMATLMALTITACDEGEPPITDIPPRTFRGNDLRDGDDRRDGRHRHHCYSFLGRHHGDGRGRHLLFRGRGSWELHRHDQRVSR